MSHLHQEPRLSEGSNSTERLLTVAVDILVLQTGFNPVFSMLVLFFFSFSKISWKINVCGRCGVVSSITSRQDKARKLKGLFEDLKILKIYEEELKLQETIQRKPFRRLSCSSLRSRPALNLAKGGKNVLVPV